MFSRRTAHMVMVATACALSLSIAAPALGATPSTTTDETSATADRHGPGARTMFGTTAPREAGEDLADAVDRQDATYGEQRTLRLFFSGLPSSWEYIRSQTGVRPLVLSFKAQPDQVIAGNHDAALRTWFANAPTDVRTWWSYYHEPEDNIEDGSFTAAQYRAAWNHIANLADAADNSKLRGTLILMCWTLENGSHREWRDYYAPDAVQMMGWDCYNAAYKNGFYRTPATLFTQVVEIADQTGMPYGISEFGSVIATGDGDGADRASWIDASAEYLRNHNAKFVTYFDSNIGVEFRLTDRNSRLAWTRAVASSWGN